MDKDFTKIGMPNLGGFGNTLNPVKLAKKIAKTPTLAYTKRVGDHNHRTTIVVDDRLTKSLGDYLQGDNDTKYRRAVLNAVKHLDSIEKYNKEHPESSIENQQKTFEKQEAEKNELDYLPIVGKVLDHLPIISYALNPLPIVGLAFNAIHRIKQLGDMIGAGVDHAMEAGKSLILGSIGSNSEYSQLADANSLYDGNNTKLQSLIRNKSDYEQLHKNDTDPVQMQNNEQYLAKLNKNILDTYKVVSDPELKKASLAYKARYINENGDPIWWKTLKYDLGFEHEDYKKDIDKRYNELINKQYQDNNGVINGKKVATAKDYANEINKNYINYLNKENDSLKLDYADKIEFLKEALDFFKVSDSYKRGEQLYQNSNLFDPKYWLYVAPGMLGSSNSSPSLLAANAIQLASTGAAIAASAVATPVVGEAILYAGTAASIPFLIQGAIDENRLEIGDKRVLNILSLLNDTSIFGKTGKEDIINDLTKQSILYYKAKGYSNDWIKKNYQSDELTVLKNIILDNLAGISRNNDPRLKKALLYSQKGLDQQFRSDNVATALELPISIAMQLAPTKYLRSELAESRIGKLVGNANSKLKNVVHKVGKKIGVTTDINKGIVNFTRNMKTNPYLASKFLTRAEIRANEKAAVASLHKGVLGSTKRVFNNIWKNKGAEIGKTIGEASGLGYAASSAGKLIGGVTNEAMRLTGKVLPKNLKNAAETFTKYTLDKYQKVYDKLLPSDAAKIFARYGKNLAGRTGISMMNESVEEGKQYIHSIEDYGKLYGYGSASLPDLIANDLAVGGRVINAYAAMMGLTDSQLKDDQEFAQNVMGGAALGGLHTGAVNVVSQYNGAISDLNTDRLLKEGHIMNREVDKMNRNANVQFATLAMNNKERRTIDWLTSLKEQDSRREAPKFTQEDYDDKLKAAAGVMSLTKNNKIKLILEAKGIKYGTDKYANAVADIYNRQEALSQNIKESTEGLNQVNKLYSSKEFNDAIDEITNDYNPEEEELKIHNIIFGTITKNTLVAPITKNTLVENHPEEATGNAIEIDWLRAHLNEAKKHIFKLNLIGLLKVTNKVRALIKLKAQLETVDGYYKIAREKLNLKTLRPDAIAVKQNIQTQLDDAKKQLKDMYGDDFDEKADDQTMLLNIDNLGFPNVQLDQIELQERTNAMLLADRSINESKLNRLFSGVETKDNGEISTDEKGNVKYDATKDKFNYSKYVDAIMDASERNAKLDWAVGDIYNGDAVNKFEDDEKVNIAKQDDINKQETAKQNDLPEVLKQPTLEVLKTPKTQVTPEEKLRTIFGKNKEKYEARKAIAKLRFLKRKARYKKWKKGNLNATIIPLQDSLIKAGNSLIKSAELGIYKISLFISDIKDITEDDDIKQYIPALKQLYIKNISKAELKGNKEVLENLSNSDEVLSYNEPIENEQILEKQPINTVYGSYAEQVQSKLDDNLKYVDHDCSTFYDTIVTKDGKTTIYTNDSAINLYKLSISNNPVIKSIVELLNSAKTEDEFKSKLEIISEDRYIPESVINKFIKYRNVNGINSVIARFVISKSKQSVGLDKAIAIRNLVSDILLGKEPNLLGLPKGIDEFVDQIKDFKLQLDKLGYTVVNTDLNIYGTTIDGKNQSAQLDILAVNKNGNIWVIDVLNSYKSIRDDYKKVVGQSARYTNEYKEGLMMNLIKSILNGSMNNEVRYISVLPVVWEDKISDRIYAEISKEDGTYKLINVETIKGDELANLKQLSDKLVERCLLMLELYKDLTKQAKQLGIEDVVNYHDNILDNAVTLHSVELYKDYITKLDEFAHSLQGNINDINDAIETKIENKDNDNEISESDYTIQDLILSEQTDKEYYLLYLIGNLDSSCLELDSLLSVLPSFKITTQDEQTAFDKLCNSIFESQIALDLYLQDSNEELDVTPYELIIASAIEKLQLNTDNFGNKAVLINKWWCYNFTRVNDNALSNGSLYNNYLNKINSWINALENHIISDDLDNDIKLLKLYSSLLNNYLTKLLSNFNKVDVKDEDRNIVRDAMVNRANTLIEDYNYKWGTEPDPNYNGNTEPEMLNAMNVLWKDEHSPSTSHSPAFDAMAMSSVYYYMSTAKDFLSPRSTKLYINIANKDYTYRFNKDSYTIKLGEPYLTIIYTNNDGRVTTANLPFTTNIDSYKNATDSLIDRIETANRGNKKLITKLLAMQKYLDKINIGKKFGDPDYVSIKVDASTNQGSLVYEKGGVNHSVNDFLFNDINNAHDLKTITLSLENRLGIFVPTYDSKTDTHTYGIYLNKFLKDKIGQFNDLYDKLKSYANPGSIIYFYKTKNGKIVKTALTYETIGEDNAKSLINLMYEYCVNNKIQIDGYLILDLLKQKLYITDYERQLNKFNDVSNRIILNHNLNIVKIGDDQFDITDHKDLADLLNRISSMYQHVLLETINENIANSDNNVFNTTAQRFKDDPNLNLITLANGYTMYREDFIDPKGQTWLGYLLKNNYITTGVKGQGYTLINIDKVSIPNTNDKIIANEDLPEKDVKEDLDKQTSRRRSLFGRLNANSANKTVRINLNGDIELLDKTRSTSAKDDLQSEVISYFEQTMGKNGTVKFEDQPYLFEISKDRVVIGACTTEAINLSKSIPMSVAYHEAFHKIFELLLPEKERDEIYSDYKSKHPDLTDKDIAEEFADLFASYMDNKYQFKNAKWYKKILLMFKKIAFSLGFIYKLGPTNAANMLNIYRNMNAGKYKNNEISESKIERFNKMFNNGIAHYEIRNPYKPEEKVKFKYLNNSNDLRDMCSALGYLIIHSLMMDETNPDLSKLKVDQNSIDLIPRSNIEALSGYERNADGKLVDVEDLNDIDRAFREVFERGKDLPVYNKNGNIIGYKHTYPKINVLGKYISDYISSISSNYSDRFIDNEDPTLSEEDKVMSLNIDKFDAVSHQFAKLDSSTQRAKYFFSTIPYCTIEKNEDGSTYLNYDLSKNKFMTPSYMPLVLVFKILSKDLYYVTNLYLLLDKLRDMQLYSAMHNYVYLKFNSLMHSLYSYDENGKLNVNYDNEAFAILILSTLRGQKIDFTVALSTTEKDTLNKQIKIKSSSLDRDGRTFANQWNTFLLSGLVRIFKKYRNEFGKLEFVDDRDNSNGKDIFSRTSKFLLDLSKSINGYNDQFSIPLIVDSSNTAITFDKNNVADIDYLKSSLIDRLNNIGIMMTIEALDNMLISKFKDSGVNGLNKLLSQGGKESITAFINTLNSFVSDDGYINEATVSNGYSNNGFVKDLATYQGIYNRLTVNNMALGLDGKRLYSESLNNSITYITSQLNTGDKDNDFVKLLNGFNYNLFKHNDFLIGSIVLKQIASGEKPNILTHVHIGFKTDNKGDNGSEYSDQSTIEDLMGKFTILQDGNFIFSTMADKGTWHWASGINIPGMKFNENIDNKGNRVVSVDNQPEIQFYNKFAFIKPTDRQLNLMIDYAICERQGIFECMEDLGYDEIPGYTKTGKQPIPKEAYIKNYHTKNKDVEPNGTRFFSLTEIYVLENGQFKTINLNDPRMSSKEALKLANKYFFDKTPLEQRQIMTYVLNKLLDRAILAMQKLGVVYTLDVDTGQTKISKSERTLYNLDTDLFDNYQIDALSKKIQTLLFGNKLISGEYMKTCRSLAIASMINDVTIRSIICSQEEMRLYSGHPGMFKVKYGTDKILDSTFDIQKRIGGMESTGDDNVVGLPGDEDDTYTCAECKDYMVASTSDISKELKDKFTLCQLREVYANYTNDWVNPYNMSSDLIIEEANKNAELKLIVDKAIKDAASYSDAYKSGINVADGAAYITADMCEKLLRMRGALSLNVVKAFEVLKGDDKYSWMEQSKAYKVIYNEVNIVTTKYTAYGFRNHELNGESQSSVSIPYYNKFALFPLFKCIATGKLSNIYDKMINEGVDMLLMDSAVKVGSQSPVSYDGNSIESPFNKYKQNYQFLRRLLNTDPEEGSKINMGTQMIKIVLLNLRLGRINYTDEAGNKVDGKSILERMMGSINKLSEIGYNELCEEIGLDLVTGEIDEYKLGTYLNDQLTDRNANKSIISAIQPIKGKDGKYHLNAPLSATPDDTWIESILISTVNKKVIDIQTPGSSFVQRSVFAMEGENGEGNIKGATIYNGKKLQMINSDNSMDAVISIDYFDSILPKRPMSFDEKRQWLIDNNIIGENAKANTIGYRIPTLAQSSIHALRFVDVCPAVKSTIILPEEFTKITGSDFDIDHLYLASYNYNVQGDNANTEFDKTDKKYYQNEILSAMLTLLKDTDNSINSLFRSIDNDTEPLINIAKKIPDQDSGKNLSYNFGTLHEQILRKNDYITGKTGIAPFALNVTSQELCRIFGVKFNGSIAETGIQGLDKLVGDDNIPISSWLSAFINAHVDIVKDPYIAKLSVDKFTYNTLNLLIRSGFGDTSVWFLCQPILKEMSYAYNNAKSEYGRDTKHNNTVYDALKEAQELVVSKYVTAGELIEHKNSNSQRISDILFIKENKKVLEEIAKHPDFSSVTVDGIKYDVKYVLKRVLFAWNSLLPYALALGDLVQHTKIDTKKQGKNLIELNDYLSKYNDLFDDKNSLFDVSTLHNLVDNSWIGYKTNTAIKAVFNILKGLSFNANKTFLRLVSDVCNKLDCQATPDNMVYVSNCVLTYYKSAYFANYAEENCENSITDMLIGQESVAHLLNYIKDFIRNDEKYSYLSNNALLNYLYTVLEKYNSVKNNVEYQHPSFISILDSVDGDRLNTEMVMDAWKDLLLDDDPMINKFAKEFIIYSFMTSGQFKGWTKLFKYVPFEWLNGEIEGIGHSYTSYIKDLLNNFDNSETLSGYEFISDMIASNNIDDYRFVKKINPNSKDSQIAYKDSMIVIVKTNGISGKPHIAIENSDSYTGAKDGYSLYKAITDRTGLIEYTLDRSGDTYTVYTRMRQRGYHDNSKFDIHEYGWNMDYNGNGSNSALHADYDSMREYILDVFNRIYWMPNRFENVDKMLRMIKYLTSAQGILVDKDVFFENVNKALFNEDTQPVSNDNKNFNGENNNETNFNNKQLSTEIISSDKTILSNLELRLIRPFTGDKPRIAVASEHSDPAFFSKKIINILNGEESVKDKFRNISYSGKDFDALYLITKHDGLPLKNLLETKIPKIIHFSITSLGGTKWEPGVMKYNDLLDRIKEFIEQGLDPNMITIRIDPIIPGVTNSKDVEQIIKRSLEMGVKNIRFSIMDRYSTTLLFMEKLGYDYDKWYPKVGKHANPEVISQIEEVMLQLSQKYGVKLSTCAEPIVKEGISQEACLSVNAINQMLGTSIPQTETGKLRPFCSCYGGKTDLLAYDNNCASSCVYCYAHHNTDRILNYYNEDGTLKDNIFTRTTDKEDVQPISNGNNTKPTFNYNSIGNKTELGNVKIVDDIFAHKDDKNIITAFRVNKNLGLILSFIKYNAIGNPFNWLKVGVETATTDFIKWLIGLDFTNYELEYRNLILSNIENLKGKTIEYYKELGRPSHATALDYLINKYDWNAKPYFTDNTLEGSINFNNTDKEDVSNTNSNDYIMNSGGAYGGDTVWDFYSRKYGITNIRHYRDSANTRLSGTLAKQGIKATSLNKEEMDFAREKVKELLGKEYKNDLRGNLQVRNFYLVYNSDGVFAIATLNNSKNGVSGGTNTAVQLGISLNKETHVFDINSEKWYIYNKDSKEFEVEDTPKLTKSFAGVGTRDILNYNVLDKNTNKWVSRQLYVGDIKKNVAFNAIEDVMKNTFGNNTDKLNILSEEDQRKAEEIKKHCKGE